MDIKFFYQNNKPSYIKEEIINKFTKAVASVIDLPPTIEICIYPLPDNLYGGIDMYKINRIGLNSNLMYKDIPEILTHELIHVHQKHTGVLKIKRDGSCYWHGVFVTKKLPSELSYQEYINLPWERDVAEKQHKVFRDALALTNNPNSCIL